MTDIELFDDYLASIEKTQHSLGKRFDPVAAFGESMKSGADGFRHRVEAVHACIEIVKARYPKAPDIYFDFLDLPVVGAWAWTWPKTNKARHFIGYAAGTEHVLRAVFMRMLADPKILDWLCEPNEESHEQSHLTGLGPDVRTIMDIKIHRPINEHRIVLAEFFSELAAIFVVDHEIAHHIQGHIGYRDVHMPLSPLKNPRYPSDESEEYLVSQTQEMHADAHATWD